MECNRDEAIRSKEIAERKFLANDIKSAKKFALKAQGLFPGLEGIGQMLATLEVHLSVVEGNGEADWYSVLGITSLADDDTMRKQYRKLALMLHPDKNKSVGAEGAFKLISEAWNLLSDKTRRSAYDQRRNGMSLQQKSTPPCKGPSPPAANGFYNFAKTTASTSKATDDRFRTNNTSDSSSAPKSNRRTFWTACLKCRMQYEYLLKFLNHNLICPNCHEAFIAKVTAPPTHMGSRVSSQCKSSQQTKNSDHHVSNKTTTSGVRPGFFDDSNANNNFQWSPFSGAAGANTVQVASMVQQTYEKVRKEREEGQAMRRREKSLKRKNHGYEKMGGAAFTQHPDTGKKRRGVYNADVDSAYHWSLRAGDVGRVNNETIQINGISKPDHLRELSGAELGNILAEKARKEIRCRFSEQEWANVGINGVQKEKAMEIANKKEKGTHSAGLTPDSCDQGSRRSGSQSRVLSESNSDTEAFQPMSISVPDPDFYDFDNDRTDRSFREQQMWAAYDDDDGMPRYYATIHRILSENPFKMQIRWLNSKTNAELSPVNWIGSGFTKTCGDFRIGRFETYDSVNAFSHKVRWSKGSRGVIHIFPRKGDVWALYRNWSSDWNELTAEKVIHKYEIVEVLDDYDKEVGVVVIPLVKVAGFKTVFHQHLDPKQVRRIPREEMFRFSHQIPSHLLSGKEAPNAPKGCWELDPAAIPVELLEVIAPLSGEVPVENEVDGWERADRDGIERESGKEMHGKSEAKKENPQRTVEDEASADVIILEGDEEIKTILLASASNFCALISSIQSLLHLSNRRVSAGAFASQITAAGLLYFSVDYVLVFLFSFHFVA
ncbi:hypothetical protein Dimus_031797 [Dionaea muscipula]